MGGYFRRPSYWVKGVTQTDNTVRILPDERGSGWSGPGPAHRGVNQMPDQRAEGLRKSLFTPSRRENSVLGKAAAQSQAISLYPAHYERKFPVKPPIHT